MSVVLAHALWRRRTSLLWWGLGLVGVVGLLAVAYPTVRDNAELDKTFSGLSPGTQALLGLGGGTTLTSPVGYLNSQFFANILPVMLLVFAVGMAAWAVAGDEAAGTLELLLANPIGRARVALARAGALLLLLGTLTAICTAALVATAQPAGLDQGLPWVRLVQASIASAALAWAFAAVAFALGAATGSRALALAVASALAVFRLRHRGARRAGARPAAHPGRQPLALAAGRRPPPARPGVAGVDPAASGRRRAGAVRHVPLRPARPPLTAVPASTASLAVAPPSEPAGCSVVGAVACYGRKLTSWSVRRLDGPTAP